MTTPPSEQELHAYVDGRLDGERRDAVERHLARHPELAAEVRAWQHDAQRLRAASAGAGALPDNPALRPAAIRTELRRRRMRTLSMAAAATLCLAVGGVVGWRARDLQDARATPPMADAIAAHRLLAMTHAAPPDVVSRREGDLQAWLDARFARAARLPDLSAAGFHARGGRLFATDQGPAAMVLYEDAAGHAISFYVRPPGPRRHFLPAGQRADDGLLAQYWSGQGYNYAMVSRDGGAEATAVLQARQRAI